MRRKLFHRALILEEGGTSMKVKDIMNKFIVVATPEETIRAVAKKMETYNVGFIVIIDDDKRPVGVVTDRDLTLRALGYGLSPETPVRNVMTHNVVAVTEEADLKETLRVMEENGVRRVPVLNEEGLAVGIVTTDEILVRLIGYMNKLGVVYAMSLRPSGF